MINNKFQSFILKYISLKVSSTFSFPDAIFSIILSSIPVTKLRFSGDTISISKLLINSTKTELLNLILEVKYLIA